MGGSFWLVNFNIQLDMDYKIGSGMVSENFRYVNDNSLCTTETYDIEYFNPNTGLWEVNDGLIVNLSAATPSPGIGTGTKLVTIEMDTSDVNYDLGGTLVPR